MREFWVASGHHLSQRLADGNLAATPELMMAWLARPELAPPPEACAHERALHAALLADPFRLVGEDEIARIEDADARENWSFFIRFRDRLAKAPSIEAAYVELARADRVDLPPMFLDQLAHLILRNALDGCDDPYVLRAGELFFRAQKASVHDGVLLLADAELVEEQQKARAEMMHTSPLTAMLQGEGADLDVMDDENAWTYWSRSDANSMAMNLGGSARAREGLAKAVAGWVLRLTGARVHVEPIARMEDKDWRWFVGLDPEGTRIGNALWRAQSLKAQDMDRVIAILRMTFDDERRVDKRVRGRPVYLFLAMGADNIVRMKPQNLVAGLPLLDPPAKGRTQ
ncbi:MAG: hypothetical protein JWN93_512 [Hyphomicrobiales bacterium]|nr:hypothetical protein [Hyphomicrobiales bacterium]